MTAHLLSLQGHTDGIRWGDIHFTPGGKRRYQLDLLSGRISLFALAPGGDVARKPDLNPERVSEALAIVTAALEFQKTRRIAA